MMISSQRASDPYAEANEMTVRLLRIGICGWLLSAASIAVAGGLVADVELLVHDADDQPLPCRIYVVDRAGKPVLAADLPSWQDHFVCPGTVKLELPPGRYEVTVERGPEFQSAVRVIEVGDGAGQKVAMLLPRISELRKSGWYSADLHVHRPPDDIELLMRAEDLDFAPVITWWNQQNYWSDHDLPAKPLHQFDGHRLVDLLAGEDEREGGALLYFGLRSPLEITRATREIPSPLRFVEEAHQRNPNVWIDIEKPFWWDVPTWLASGHADSIGIANNHMWRAGVLPDEAWGRPRDKKRLPDPTGNALWTQEIYFHVLSAGLRIPPSAGSASGVLPNPVGYNRVYVHVGEELTHERWWQRLGEGKCFVTNGPLIVCRAGGELPGHVFHLEEQELSLPLEVSLTSRGRVRQLEVIHNGEIVKTIPCTAAVSQNLRRELTIDRSGWFLVRAVTDVDQTYRFGCTGPFYVTTDGEQQPISRASCEFFLQWVQERIDRIRENVQSPDGRRNILRYHHAARDFWQRRLDRATAP